MSLEVNVLIVANVGLKYIIKNAKFLTSASNGFVLREINCCRFDGPTLEWPHPWNNFQSV